MRTRAMIGVTALVLIAALASWRFVPDTGLPRAKAQAGPPAIPVTPGTVVTRDMPEYLHGIGTVQAFNAVTVKSRVDGPIDKVAFAEGQEVKTGDLLFQIDPRPYQAALEQAVAAREQDEARLTTAEADLARYARLVGSGFQTRQSFDQQRGLVQQLQAAIKGDAAQINTAGLNLSFTDIRSPIDGRLGARLVDIGNLVHSSSDAALVTITQLKPIFVSFTLPQNTLDAIREQQLGKPLRITALSGDGKTELAEGTLTLIDNTIDQATGTIHLKATFPNENERLWPGEFVNVRLLLRMRPAVVTVPAETLQPGPQGDFAYVITKDDTVERRVVDVAGVQDGLAVVKKGLTAGERVVVQGQYRLTNGAKVKLLSQSSSGAAG